MPPRNRDLTDFREIKPARRLKNVLAGRSNIPLDLEDDRIALLLDNRRISWVIRPTKKARDPYLTERATVRTRTGEVRMVKSGRAIEFIENETGKFRTVLLKQIYGIR